VSNETSVVAEYEPELPGERLRYAGMQRFSDRRERAHQSVFRHPLLRLRQQCVVDIGERLPYPLLSTLGKVAEIDISCFAWALS
jgi:hypothetical protein